MIEPTQHYVLVQPDPKTEDITTAGGLHVQKTHINREGMKLNYKWGTIISAGSACKPLEPGYRITYNPYDEYEAEGDTVLIPMIAIGAYIPS